MNREKERGTPLHKEPCEKCGSSDAKQVFEKPSGEIDAFCFSCETYFPPDDETQAVKSFLKRHKSKPMFDINNVESLATRGIRGVR